MRLSLTQQSINQECPPPTNINQRVKRIAGLTDVDVAALEGFGITTEDDLSYVKFEDLGIGTGIGLIKRRKLDLLCKFLSTRKDQLTATITIDSIQEKVESPIRPAPRSDSSSSSADNCGGPKVNTNPLPVFSGNPVDYESWQLQAGATIRQTSYKHYLTRPAEETLQ